MNCLIEKTIGHQYFNVLKVKKIDTKCKQIKIICNVTYNVYQLLLHPFWTKYTFGKRLKIELNHSSESCAWYRITLNWHFCWPINYNYFFPVVYSNYSRTCIWRPPMGPMKYGLYIEVLLVEIWCNRDLIVKILVLMDRWHLYRGGHYSRFYCTTYKY